MVQSDKNGANCPVVQPVAGRISLTTPAAFADRRPWRWIHGRSNKTQVPPSGWGARARRGQSTSTSCQCSSHATPRVTMLLPLSTRRTPLAKAARHGRRRASPPRPCVCDVTRRPFHAAGISEVPTRSLRFILGTRARRCPTDLRHIFETLNSRKRRRIPMLALARLQSVANRPSGLIAPTTSLAMAHDAGPD